jgi:redox-sensitive bicupin YhaK (pirin superfamily)
MIVKRPAAERGHTKIGWLDSWHTFSFGDYEDPRYIQFRCLRVLNDDRVAAGAGFPSHPHRDMEILTYVLSGQLEHRDSLHNGSIIAPGDVQLMCAGRGVVHSEFNPSSQEAVHFLQIWLMPAQMGLPAGYQQRHFSDESMRGKLQRVADPQGRDGALLIHQDVVVYAARLDKGAAVRHDLAKGRYAWVQLARGAMSINGIPFAEGDGAALSEELAIELTAAEPAEILLFDLP